MFKVNIITGGAQGNTGTIEFLKDDNLNSTPVKHVRLREQFKKGIYFYKISKKVNDYLYHEYDIMKTISKYCYTGHLVRPVRIDILDNCLPYNYINTLNRKFVIEDSKFNPFTCTNKKTYNTPILFTQYIPDTYNIKDILDDMDAVLSCLLQVYMILYYLSDLEYNHGDLHTDNILLKRIKPCVRRYQVGSKHIYIPCKYLVILIDHENGRTYKDNEGLITYKTAGMRNIHVPRKYYATLDYYYFMKKLVILVPELTELSDYLYGTGEMKMNYDSYIDKVRHYNRGTLFNKYIRELCIITISMVNTDNHDYGEDLNIQEVINAVSALVDKLAKVTQNNLDMLVQYRRLVIDRLNILTKFAVILHGLFEDNFEQVDEYIEDYIDDKFRYRNIEDLICSVYKYSKFTQVDKYVIIDKCE